MLESLHYHRSLHGLYGRILVREFDVAVQYHLEIERFSVVDFGLMFHRDYQTQFQYRQSLEYEDLVVLGEEFVSLDEIIDFELLVFLRQRRYDNG